MTAGSFRSEKSSFVFISGKRFGELLLKFSQIASLFSKMSG